MAPDNSHDTRSDETAPERRLNLELAISDSQPFSFSGRIGRAGAPDRVPFRGWIDLMSAIHALCDITTPPPNRWPGPAPGTRWRH